MKEPKELDYIDAEEEAERQEWAGKAKAGGATSRKGGACWFDSGFTGRVLGHRRAVAYGHSGFGFSFTFADLPITSRCGHTAANGRAGVPDGAKFDSIFRRYGRFPSY